MVKLSVLALWGASIVMVVVLCSYVQQELYMYRSITRKISQMTQESAVKPLSRDKWQQVYNLAKASKDTAAFFDFLRAANIAPEHTLSLATRGSNRRSELPSLPSSIPSLDLPGHSITATARTSDAHAQHPPERNGYNLSAASAATAALSPISAMNVSANGLIVPQNEPVLPASAPKHEAPLPAARPVLDRDLAWKHARENVIIVTWTNFHFYDFVENWAEHLSNHRIKNFLVGAMDNMTADSLEQRGVPYFVMYELSQSDTGLGTQDFGWGSGKFHLMGRLKINLLKTFLGFGLDIMLCDTDTVWINDPTDYFNRFPAADVLTSSDHMSPSWPAGDDGLEHPLAVHSAMNIGVMFFRHSQHTKDFVAEWVAKMDADPKMWDQNAFNQLARSGFDQNKVHESNKRLFYGWNGRLVMGILPVAAFASGHTYHVQRLFEVMEVKPYVVHQTFQYGGTKGKRHRLREANLWYDPPAYYRDGAFLHVELDYLPPPPDFEKLEEFNMSEFHLANMEYQLLQLREAFAAALALERTVILPKLQCFCDRYWGPVHRCRLPGASKLRLPFVCPLDHIFEPFHFDDKPGEFGRPIPFREHSFLENERTPASVRDGAQRRLGLLQMIG